MRPIDADKINLLDAIGGQSDFARDVREVVQEVIDKQPTLDVEPVRHGSWDGEGDGYADGEIVLDVWHCSQCGYCIDDGTDDPDLLPSYCPNCGAKMDGGSE